MVEKEATKNRRCPDCGGKLNAIIGVHGREFCRVCKIPVVTSRNNPRFDEQEWEYKEDSPGGCAQYGPVDGGYTEDPRSIGSETEFDIIETTIEGGEVTNKGLIAEGKKRKSFHCNICGGEPCESEVPGGSRTPSCCLYMHGQGPQWIPDWIKKGAKCNYHSIIGEDVTEPDCTITSEIFELGDTPCVKIDKKAGGVSVFALSPVEEAK